MATLQQIARWKGQRNALEHVYGNNAICPTIIAHTQSADNAMMVLVCQDFDEPEKNLRGLYMESNEELKILVEGNRWASGHESGKNINPDGVACTVKENHGEPQTILVKANNSKGYDEMTDGDALDVRYPSSETRRGRVGHGVAQTVQTDGGENQAVCVYDAYNHRNVDGDKIGTLGAHSYHESGNCGTFYIGEHPRYRIRKLTERECFRLMGVKDADSKRVARNQCKSSMYHLAGDSIVTACLMAIFGEMFDVDYKGAIKELQESITTNE